MKVYGHQHSSEVFSRETSPSCFEPKAEKVIAFHGKDASYAYNVLADLKAAGASCSAVWVWNEVWAMEHVKRQIQQGAGNAYYAGMQWRGITLGHADAAALNQFDIDISKAQAPEARTWLLQNKAEFIALMLGIEIVKIG